MVIQNKKEKELTPAEWKEGLYIMAEKAVYIQDGEVKDKRWDRETRVTLVYSVLCSLARLNGAKF